MKIEEPSYASYGGIDGVFPCRCCHKSPFLTDIFVLFPSFQEEEEEEEEL